MSLVQSNDGPAFVPIMSANPFPVDHHDDADRLRARITDHRSTRRPARKPATDHPGALDYYVTAHRRRRAFHFYFFHSLVVDRHHVGRGPNPDSVRDRSLAAEERDQAVGKIVSGLLLGVLFARAVSGIRRGTVRMADGIFLFGDLAADFDRGVGPPTRRPGFSGNCGQLLASLYHIFMGEPILRRRAAYQSTMFTSFTAF
jgi:hypothetical protein